MRFAMAERSTATSAVPRSSRATNARTAATRPPIYHGTNAVARLYASTGAPQRLARQLILRGAQHLPPLKGAITARLTGRGGLRLPGAVA